ncbi:F0F1 ATP synthase subunit gamma [Gloeobacter kilaueensis]|uniref:ATP synthase gamma chain n=1 Tax=Gloeobacter kilaueensis (strain ATCC BAA-2537 / CCAP 1431/1 / ULC 316 / JS1) TaxID=1183438 RepID=U5QJR0_GLOK1|nr:F0F1 ATP synthase subunit gamma [Gloeobacter kilaueensis]AGY57890.1 F0F1 ATP synthase subunit gamma [Gloeobacter kilaueensis JS1]
MPNLRGIRDRIKSVRNTRKITKAMRLVAAARVRRAQEQVLATRPFADRLVGLLFRLRTRLRFEDVQLPLFERREVKTVAVIVIAGERGLCGAYNANILRRAVEYLRQLKAEGKDFRLYPVGNKATAFFRRSSFPVAQAFPNVGQAPTMSTVNSIIDEVVIAPFLAGAVDQVELIYTRFVSLISSRPTLQTLLPLDPNALTPEDETFRLTTKDGTFQVSRERLSASTKTELSPDTLFEQDAGQLLEALLPLYLGSQMLRALQEGAASELAARMTAMSAASDNASKLLTTLTIVYNKARQAAITQEILEVVAGANA